MQNHAPPVAPPPPRVFNYSLDWRFLLPISDPSRVFVVFEEEADLSQTLTHVGISASNQLSLADVKREQALRAESFVLPFGWPVRWVGMQAEDHIELYRSLRWLIEPGGHFLIGFNNAWYGHRSGSKYHSARPGQVASQLHQAGYRSIEILGVMPDLSIPEYILHLEPQSILFALCHRFRRKPVILKLLQVFSHAPGWARMSSFLPCYFAVAVA